MIALLDVNVLVALAWPNHVHHAAARQWFLASHAKGWATCSITQTGFVRVSSNASVTPAAVRPVEGAALLRELTALAGHRFWPDDVPLANSPHVEPVRIAGYRQVTDAQLIGLCLRHGGQLATFDAKLAALVPAKAKRSPILLLRS